MSPLGTLGSLVVVVVRGRPSGHGPAVGPLGRFESKGRVKLPKKLDSNNVVIIHGIQTAAQGFDVYYHS